MGKVKTYILEEIDKMLKPYGLTPDQTEILEEAIWETKCPAEPELWEPYHTVIHHLKNLWAKEDK